MKLLRLVKCKFDNTDSLSKVLDFEQSIFPKLATLNDGTEGGYPLIQFKWQEYRGEFSPLILCVEDGIEQAFPIFDSLNNSSHTNLQDISIYKRVLQIWQEMFCYELHNWEAFYQIDYANFSQVIDFDKNKHNLESLLLEHIKAFLIAVGHNDFANIKVKIKLLKKITWNRVGERTNIGFSISFETNVSLPDWLSLGYGAARGTGIVLSRQKANLEKIFPKTS
jgi:hypothetical protein